MTGAPEDPETVSATAFKIASLELEIKRKEEEIKRLMEINSVVNYFICVHYDRMRKFLEQDIDAIREAARGERKKPVLMSIGSLEQPGKEG